MSDTMVYAFANHVELYIAFCWLISLWKKSPRHVV